MRRIVTRQVGALVTAGIAVCLLGGCEVNSHKNGDSEDVKIATPFGGMRVRTNDSVNVQDIGLPAYPGARLVRQDKDNGSADVNMSFGGFQLRVKAASYRTDDPPAKVEAFYRDGLKRFGDVIACRNDRPVGTPAHTADGLTCDSQKENHVSVEDHSKPHNLELKAGSKVHQHIVAIDADGGGTKFGLVALDLPGRVFSDSDDNDDEGKQ